MFRSTWLTGTYARASGIFVLYACGMGGLVLSNLYLGKHLVNNIVVYSFPELDASEVRRASRVERRLKQIAEASLRVERPVRPGVRAYTIPNMNAARLAVAMDRTEHPTQPVTIAAIAPAELVETSMLQPGLNASEQLSDGAKIGDTGSRVAGYLAVATVATIGPVAIAVEDGSGVDTNGAVAGEDTDISKPKASATKVRRAKRRSNAISRARFDEDDRSPVRFAETPGEIIQRKLGGTT